jgi:hypothetical protein
MTDAGGPPLALRLITAAIRPIRVDQSREPLAFTQPSGRSITINAAVKSGLCSRTPVDRNPA